MKGRSRTSGSGSRRPTRCGSRTTRWTTITCRTGGSRWRLGADDVGRLAPLLQAAGQAGGLLVGEGQRVVRRRGDRLADGRLGAVVGRQGDLGGDQGAAG